MVEEIAKKQLKSSTPSTSTLSLRKGKPCYDCKTLDLSHYVYNYLFSLIRLFSVFLGSIQWKLATLYFPLGALEFVASFFSNSFNRSSLLPSAVYSSVTSLNFCSVNYSSACLYFSTITKTVLLCKPRNLIIINEKSLLETLLLRIPSTSKRNKGKSSTVCRTSQRIIRRILGFPTSLVFAISYPLPRTIRRSNARVMDVAPDPGSLISFGS